MNGYLIISLIWALFAPGGAGGASHLPVYARLSHSGNGRVFMRQSVAVQRKVDRWGVKIRDGFRL
jgi:hypothetical protein